jgi:hypothetical protein
MQKRSSIPPRTHAKARCSLSPVRRVPGQERNLDIYRCERIEAVSDQPDDKLSIRFDTVTIVLSWACAIAVFKQLATRMDD